MSPKSFNGFCRSRYDYMGRRIRKYRQTMSGGESMMMSSSESTSTTSSLTEGGSESDGIVDETKFMYDGWLLTLELNGTSVVQRSYFYGLDLSGSMQGAGGIGGLLFQGTSGTPTTSNTRWFSHDPQGNVTNLRSLSDDSRWASIEYGPFGERLTASSSNLDQFKLRFSGKYFDEETGLSYFGYRYYNANTGRWINRDPAGESRGMNILAFVENRTASAIDALGLESWSLDPNKCTAKLRMKLSYNFEGTWTDQRKKFFISQSKSIIEGSWNNSGYTIKPRSGIQNPTWIERNIDFIQYSCCPCAYMGWTPLVELTIVEGAWSADFSVAVQANPISTFPNQITSSVTLQTHSAQFDEQDVLRRSGMTPNGPYNMLPTVNPAYAAVPGQFPIVHEFGHMLGLLHPDPSQRNSIGAYLADPPALMGLGSEFRPQYFEKWRKHLDSEYSRCSKHLILPRR